jgi:hypothetical protein
VQRNLTYVVLGIFMHECLFFILSNSRDDAVYPKGICGLGNTKETSFRPSAGKLKRKNTALGGALSGYDPLTNKKKK